jgi:hypothetical protein
MEGHLKDAGQRMQWCHQPLKLDSSRNSLGPEERFCGDYEIFKREKNKVARTILNLANLVKLTLD